MPKSNENPHLGKKLLEAMARKNVKQVDVADHFKVKPPTVSGDWIKFGRIGKKHIPELVNYFGLPYEWWFGEEEKIGSATNLTEEQKNILQLASRMGTKAKENWIAIGTSLTSVTPTQKAVDKAEAQPIELEPIPAPDKESKRDSAWRNIKAGELFRPGGSSRGDGKKILKKEGNK